MDETYYRHRESCSHKDSSDIEKRNIQEEEIDGQMINVIFDCYCKTWIHESLLGELDT